MKKAQKNPVFLKLLKKSSLHSTDASPDTDTPEMIAHRKRQQEVFLNEKVNTSHNKSGVQSTKTVEKESIQNGKRMREITEFLGGEEYSGLNWDSGNTIR